MNETNRRPVEQDQYVQLGLTPQPSPPEPPAWDTQSPSYLYHNTEMYTPRYTPQAVPFSYVQPHYVQDSYEKCMYQRPNLYQQFFIAQPENTFIHPQNYPDTTSHTPTQLIENVVGNWVPNTTGTYSPFGNTNTANIFDVQPDEYKIRDKENEDFCNFHFNNRDVKKPRIVAEVKPMRPTYSDVLTKSPPNIIKSNKVEVKDLKQKKENKKVAKNSSEKGAKVNLHRLNSDIKIEKIVGSFKTNDKKGDDFEQLNRRWSSLENLHTSYAKKQDEVSPNRNKTTAKSSKKCPERDEEVDDVDNKNETSNITKTIRKSVNKTSSKLKNDEKTPNGKRTQRNRKREKQVTFGLVGQKIKQYVPGWWKLFVSFGLWLVNLVSDTFSLTVHLCTDIVSSLWKVLTVQWGMFITTTTALFGHMKFLTWFWDKVRKKKEPEEGTRSHLHYTELDYNIAMPSTGDEAMKRLLACKGKDPYSILGVTPTCTDDDVKRYYKRQAFLVHPDKNQQPGAEEAFKILVHAFDMIGEPERRARYDRGVAESAQVEQAWSKLTELLAELQKKVEAAANTIRCSACGLRHKRIKIDRPSYAARNCATCKIHHSAREGDIWAEAKYLGFLWHYYACMDGGIYDITEWAGCQKDSLKHLKPNSHNVQYRIALGKKNGQQPRHSASTRNEQPNLENLMNSLYGNGNEPPTKRKNKKTK